jgi:hypothetical protein
MSCSIPQYIAAQRQFAEATERAVAILEADGYTVVRMLDVILVTAPDKGHGVAYGATVRSSTPNLQQIPRHTVDSRRIMQALSAPHGRGHDIYQCAADAQGVDRVEAKRRMFGALYAGKRADVLILDEVEHGPGWACTPGSSKRKPRPWYRKERW